MAIKLLKLQMVEVCYNVWSGFKREDDDAIKIGIKPKIMMITIVMHCETMAV